MCRFLVGHSAVSRFHVQARQIEEQFDTLVRLIEVEADKLGKVDDDQIRP